MPFDIQYYLRHGDKVFGPFDLVKLQRLARAGRVGPGTPIREGKAGQWEFASSILEIENFAADSAGQVRPTKWDEIHPSSSSDCDHPNQDAEKFVTTRNLARNRDTYLHVGDETEISTELQSAWHRDPIWRGLLIGCSIVLVIAVALEFRRNRHSSQKASIQTHLQKAKAAEANGQTRKIYDALVVLIGVAGNYEPDNDTEQEMIRTADQRMKTLAIALKEELDFEVAQQDAERQANREAWTRKASENAIILGVFLLIGSIVFLCILGFREHRRQEGIRTRCPKCDERHAIHIVGEILLKETFRPKTVTTVNVYFANDGDLQADGLGLGSKQVIITVQEYISVSRCQFCAYEVRSQPQRREIQE